MQADSAVAHAHTGVAPPLDELLEDDSGLPAVARSSIRSLDW